MVKTTGLKTVSARLTAEMHNKLLERLKTSDYVSVSDYIRDLIRRDLEKEAPE